MTEVELQRMVVRLTGDGSAFQKMLQEAQNNLKSFAASIASTMGSVGLIGWLTGARKSFEDLQKGQMQLAGAIAGNGGAVKELTEDYLKFAKAVAAVTTTGKGEVLGMLKKAEVYGLSGDAAKAAVKNAIALAAATGQDTESTLHATVAMAQGNYHMLRRIPAFRGLSNETEILAKFTKLTASGWNQAEIAGQTNEAQIERLKRTFNELRQEIGKNLSEAMKPLIKHLQEAADWFKKLDPETKKVIVTVGTMAASFVSIKSSMGFLWPILAKIGTAFAALGGPWVLAIAAVLIAVKVLVDYFGGFEKVMENVKGWGAGAWEWIKEKIEAFVEWSRPVFLAWKSYMLTIWEGIQLAAEAVWNFVKQATQSVVDFVTNLFSEMGMKVALDWDSIRDAVRDAFILAEFVLRNFGDVADLVWTGAKLGFVQFYNEVIHFFTEVMPAALSWFEENWDQVLKMALDWAGNAFISLGENVVTVFNNIPWAKLWDGFVESLKWIAEKTVDVFTALPKLISKAVTFGEAFGSAAVDVTAKEVKKIPGLFDAERARIKPFEIPVRDVGKFEADLRKEFEEKKDKLGKSFEEFRKGKLEEFEKDAAKEAGFTEKGKIKAMDDALKVGTGIGKKIGEGIKNEKLEGVLAGSAEALSRIAAFREKLGEVGKAGGPSGGGSASASSPVPVKVESDKPEKAKEVKESSVDSRKVELLTLMLNSLLVIQQDTNDLASVSGADLGD